MKRTVVAVIASAAIAAGATVAFAQQDPINSAPTYNTPAPVGAGASTKINDGINSAPNYSPMAPAGGGASAAAKINDGINGAPNYNSMTTAAAPKTAKHQTASVKSTQQHATHHKHRTPAS